MSVKFSLLHMILPPLFWFGTAGSLALPVQAPSRDELIFVRDQASKLLDSQDASNRAWGAYLVGQNGLSELQPRLANLLDGIDASSVDECLIRSILDAEIRQGADLPTKILTKFYGRYPNEVTILFARSPEKNADAILPLFERERSVTARWLALGDLLLEGKAHDFPLVLMRQMQRIHLSITLTDLQEGGIGGSWGEGIDDLKVPIGFPPVCVYDLSNKPIRGSIVIATGTHTIYASRTIVYAGQGITIRNGGGLVSDYWDSNAYRFEYLGSILGLAQNDTAFSEHLVLRWNGAKQFIADVRSHCTGILQKYELIAALLQKKGLIARSDATDLQPEIALRISDLRKDKAVPLPEIQLPRVSVEK